jgi:hypothetical protein
VDFALLMTRLRMYCDQEKQSMDMCRCGENGK